MKGKKTQQLHMYYSGRYSISNTMYFVQGTRIVKNKNSEDNSVKLGPSFFDSWVKYYINTVFFNEYFFLLFSQQVFYYSYNKYFIILTTKGFQITFLNVCVSKRLWFPENKHPCYQQLLATDTHTCSF